MHKRLREFMSGHLIQAADSYGTYNGLLSSLWILTNHIISIYATKYAKIDFKLSKQLLI